MFGWKAKPVGQPHSVIDVDTELQGPLKSRGYMEIRGRVIGPIEHEGTVVIAAEGYCQGGIHASEVVIAGEVRGDVVVTDKLRIKAGGKLSGDAVCSSLAIEPGATFNGRNRVGESPRPAYAGPEYAVKNPPLTGEPSFTGRKDALRILHEPVDGPALESLTAEPTTFKEAGPAASTPTVEREAVAAEPVAPADAEADDMAFHGTFRGGRFGRSVNAQAANQ
ncbi:MAG: bactofilin family protein [Mycobacterium leprae]